jgi:hypothetical protein
MVGDHEAVVGDPICEVGEDAFLAGDLALEVAKYAGVGADLGRVVRDLGRIRDEPVGQLAEEAADP